MQLCPVCDPEPFLWLLGLKSRVKLIPLGLGNSNPLVLRHYPVIDGSVEESMLVGEERERAVPLKQRMGVQTAGELGLT